MFTAEIQDSVAYLSSPEAVASLEADSYWPKWNSPWWHMLVLHEMGEGGRIPEAAVDALVDSLNALPLKIFPIHPEDMPQGLDPFRHSSCHCAVGNVYQILAGRGVNVDERVPWLRPWMLQYQMADGGMSCDNEAYLVSGECPSSMVGTIPPFEAILRHTPRAFTAEEENFLDRCAAFLIGRRLTEGSSSKHNAEEREQAKAWTKLCFPRLYFYDVLRGLSALLEWSERRGKPIPWEAIRETVDTLVPRSSRLSFEGCTTLSRIASGEWQRRQPATFFPLLGSASRSSVFLEKEWAIAHATLARLRERGLIT